MGEAAPLGSLPRIGEHIDRYEVVAEIAHGGMAAVYAVRRSSIGGFDKLLAMKVLLPHLQSDRKYVEMFLDEARIAANIQHPNVVHVFDVGEHEGSPFMVMEFLRGQSLSRVRKKAHASSTPLSLGLISRILAQTAEGLHAAHEAVGPDAQPLRIVHRDVSPQNIHIGYDGLVKVVDFGIAAARGKISATRSGELKGKLAYVAPEQIDRSSPVDRRTDIWALGVTAWELLAGRRLFKADDDGTRLWKILNMEIPDIREVAQGTPRNVGMAIMACLARDPDHRPATCQSLAETFHVEARKHGLTRPSDVTGHMNALFASEKAVEEERIAAAQRKGPPPPLVEKEATSPSGQSISTSEMEIEVRPMRPSGRAPLLALGGGLLLAIAVAVGVVLGSGEVEEPVAIADSESESDSFRSPPPGSDSESDSESGSESESESEPAPAPTETITLHVDEAARLVLVDGERQSDRPLRIALLPDQVVSVELVAPSGELVAHRVGAEDDGRTLTLPEARARMGRSRGGMMTSGSGTMMRRAILGNPY